MLCQRCQKRIANVHFTQIVNNNKVELYLCEHCAKEKGQFSFSSPFGISNFFPGLTESVAGGGMQFMHPLQQEEICSRCGMSYEEFQKTGKLGCSNCYHLFGDRMKPILRRLHGNAGHTGKVPGKVAESLQASREMEDLKEQLGKAIQREEYEKAAELRDRIRALESGSKG